MKNIFKGFYNPSEEKLAEIWKSEKTIFIFDTNVLLNVYSYEEKTRNDFFSLLEMMKDQIWIPFYVGLEYQHRRLDIIKNEKQIFSKIYTHLETINNYVDKNFVELKLDKRLPKLQEKTSLLSKEIKNATNKYKRTVASLDKKQPCVRSHDKIRETLDILFDGKIGNEPENQDNLNLIFKEGETRYKNKIPPGFKDAKKGNNKDNSLFYNNLEYKKMYGDLIIWKQILNKSKEDNIKNVILITDDNKDDWWYNIESRGPKQVGPHAYLINEILQESNLDIFHMYNTSSFLDKGKNVFDLHIDEKSIEEALTIFNENRYLIESDNNNYIKNTYNYINIIENIASKIFGENMIFDSTLPIKEFQIVLDKVVHTLPLDEQLLLKTLYNDDFTEENDISLVLDELNLNKEIFDDKMNLVYRRLRHPNRSVLLKSWFRKAL